MPKKNQTSSSLGTTDPGRRSGVAPGGEGNRSPFTPGPWQAKGPDSTVKSGFTEALAKAEIPCVTVISMGTMFALGVDVAAVPAYASPEEAEANARLIAAAPDLLSALERLAQVAFMSGPAYLTPGMKAALDAAAKAIAKAVRP